MNAFKALLTLSVVGLAHSQQESGVFNAYSPGAYSAAPVGGVYRATPRLVPVKVSRRAFSSSRTSPLTHSSPFAHNTSPQISTHHPRLRGSQQQLPHYTSDPTSQSSTQDRQTYYVPRHIRIRSQPPYQHESGQPLFGAGGGQVVKRIRVNPQPVPYAAAAVEQPVQFTHTVPAVSSYRPQQAYAPQQPQPAYYGQPQVQQRPKLVKQVQAAPTRTLRPQVPASETEELPEEYASDPNPQYNFAFDVKDDDLTNYQNRQEQREGGIVKGSYSVVDPDGYVRTVTYEASPKGGFQAKVTREPTDVKIKFPVPTEAPEVRGQPAYNTPQQYQQAQPMYQPQQQYAAQPQQGHLGAGRFPQQGHRLAPRYQQ